MSVLAFVVIFGFASLALWVALMKPKISLYMVIFLAPWQGLDIDIGLRLTAYQIFLAAVVIATFIRIANNKIKKSVLPGESALYFFILYGIVLSLIQMISLPIPDEQITGGLLRSPEFRAVIQIFMFLFTISPVFLVPWILRRPEELLNAGRVYLWSAIILAILGWFQLLVWYGTGVNPIPIGLVNDILSGAESVRQGSYVFMDLSIYRMNSFGGEPKGLGSALVIAVLIIQIVLTTMKTVGVRKLIYLWVFMALSTIATLSTTAFILWVIGTLAHLVAQKFLRLARGNLKVSVGWIIGVLLVVMFFLGLGAQMIGIPITDMILDRTVNRVSESRLGIFEDFDSAILNYLIDYPVSAITGVGFGNIHLYADSYLDPLSAVYAGGGVFVAKAQYLRMISEVGIIGVVLFLFWYSQLIFLTNRRLNKVMGSVDLKILIPIGSTILLTYMAAGYVAAQFYLMSGVISAAYSISRTAKK